MNPAIYIETSGCAFNVSDSEMMAGELLRAGYRLAESPDDADLIILNTCTVKDKTYRDFRSRLEKLRDTPVIVAGCVPKAYQRVSPIEHVSTLGPDAVSRVAEVVGETLRGRVTHALEGDRERSRLQTAAVRRNPIVEILPIARGCRSACTFCQTRLARGRLTSFRPLDLVEQARRAIGEGAKEIWVTAQDTGAYGFDIGASLPDLLAGLLTLRGEFRVRLGMSSPQWIHERLGELIDLFHSPHMFQFLHVPLQSGSPAVLDHMRRDGGVDQFLEIHAAFHRAFPEINFVTDLIVGYPTETDADHGMTLDLIHELRLGFVNVSRFSARPGTAAARLKALPHAVVSERTREFMSAVRAQGDAYLQARVGREEWVMIEETAPMNEANDNSKRRSALAKARTAAYRPVFIGGPATLGESFTARLTSARPFHFYGERVPS